MDKVVVITGGSRGARLSDSCGLGFEVDWENPMLKPKDVTQASTLDLHGAFVRRTDLSGASLRCANMTKVDAANAVFRGADFEGALLNGAILRGADLTGAKNLTLEQLSSAVIDDQTALPT